MADKKITILGAGSWGSAIGQSLALSGHQVCLWTKEHSHAEELKKTRKNSFLPDIMLHENIDFTSNFKQAVEGSEMVFIAVPSQYFISVAKELGALLAVSADEKVIAIFTKGFLPKETQGIDDSNILLLTQALERELPEVYQKQTVYVSGPSHAEEMARGVVTGLVAACENVKKALAIRDVLSGKYVKVFASFDVVGVQVAASLKNVMAIAFGIMEAFKEEDPHGIIGDNTESFLFAGSLNEIQQVGRMMGSSYPETFTSVAGVGDLDVTCRSQHGRNRRFGREIVLKGILDPFSSIQDLMESSGKLGFTAEGIFAAYYGYHFCRKHNIKAPLIQIVFAILDKKMEPRQALDIFLRNS